MDLHDLGPAYNPPPAYPASPAPWTTQSGWLCPVCGTVNAPWMPTCTGKHVATVTVTTSESLTQPTEGGTT